MPGGYTLDRDMEGEVEPLITGEFIKYHNNDGKADQIIGMPRGLMAEVLIHFSLEHSNWEMVFFGYTGRWTHIDRSRNSIVP